jgi:hypothetical protein
MNGDLKHKGDVGLCDNTAIWEKTAMWDCEIKQHSGKNAMWDRGIN